MPNYSAAYSEDGKIISIIKADRAMVFFEVEPLSDAIIFFYDGTVLYGEFFSKQGVIDIIAGVYEPNGLLPMQQPASMEAVEKQAEDTARDCECYVDADGNTYDFAFGLNWSGVINYERVAKYNVPVLTEPTNITEW